MTLTEFMELYRSLGEARSKRTADGNAHNERYMAEVEAAYRAVGPGKKKLPSMDEQKAAIGEVAHKAIFDNALADARIDDKANQSVITAITEQLWEEAVDIPVPIDGQLREIRRVDEWQFSTQTNPAFYARVKAKVWAEGYRLHTPSVEVIESKDPQTDMVSVVIYAKTTADGAILLLYKVGLDMFDDVKLCLKLGANPQVIWNNLLPADYKERMGIDWQGNDLPKEKAA